MPCRRSTTMTPSSPGTRSNRKPIHNDPGASSEAIRFTIPELAPRTGLVGDFQKHDAFSKSLLTGPKAPAALHRYLRRSAASRGEPA
jgi:hypothetical protein